MANKALWEVLDSIKIKYDDFSPCEFCAEIEEKMGEGYEIEVWDHDDYNYPYDMTEELVRWISDHTKGKIVVDLQIECYETDDPGDEAFITVVALKTKEV